jgi:hypothetical protein
MLFVSTAAAWVFCIGVVGDCRLLRYGAPGTPNIDVRALRAAARACCCAVARFSAPATT